MKYAAFSRHLIISCLIILSTFLVACQEDKGKPEASKGAASSPQVQEKASTMIPAVSQGAPVPQGQNLEILRFGPSGEIDKLTMLTAMFNQPMVALGDYHNVPEGVLLTDPPIEGDRLWLNQYTLAFIPKTPLTGSMELGAKLDLSKLKALSGAASSESSEIEIKLPELKALNAYKSDTVYDEDQDLMPSWHIYFNQPLDKASLAEKVVFVYVLSDGTEKRIPAAAKSDEAQSSSFIFRAQERLPKNTAYRLMMEEGVKSAAGPRPSQEIELANGSTYGPLSIKTEDLADKPISPDRGLYLSFSNPVDFSEIVPLISIDNGYDLNPLKEYYAKDSEPTDKADEEYESVDNIGSFLYIDGRFRADEQYSLTVSSAAKDIFGQSLEADFSLKFKTGQYPTSLELGNSYGLLETATDPRVKLVASNINEAHIKAYAFSAEEAIRFMSASRFSPDYYYGNFEESKKILENSESREITIAVPGGAKDGRSRIPVDLKKIYGDEMKGHLLFLQSSWLDDGKEWRQTFALMQVSDIGLAIKVGPSSSLIWTTDLSAGRSWAGVELEVRGPEGDLLWKGQSDESGLAKLPGTAELIEQMKKVDGFSPGIYVVAKSGDQMSLWNADWNEGLENWRWNFNYTNAISANAEEKHILLSALPLYKPGEKAALKLISRSNKADRYENYAGKQIYMEIRDGLGRTAAKADLNLSSFGTGSYELDIPAGATLGRWAVLAGKDAENLNHVGSFLVMTYRAPAFEIKFENFKKETLAGDEINIEAKADYHFGAPVAKQSARYNVVSSPAWFSLPGDFASYHVTNDYYQADEEEDSGYGYTEPSVTVASNEAKLDADGRLKFPLSLKPGPDQKPAPRNYAVYLSVNDVDQRQVSTNNSFLVHPAALYVGLNSGNFVGESGQAFPIKIIAANHDGRLVPGRKISADVYRRSWQNVRRKSAGTNYEYVSRMVDEKISEHKIVSKDAPVEVEIIPEKPGYYIVQAAIKDDKGRENLASYSFYVSGKGDVGWRMSNNDNIALIPDKLSYKPGETARIMVQSPFDQGEGLLTVERAGIRLSRVFKVENQTPIVEIPLSDDDSPNIFVSVLLSRGRISETLNEAGADFGKPIIRIGYTELKVSSDKNLLLVDVKSDKAEVGPGDEVEVEIAVTDSAGAFFAEAEVALIAADAAVIQLGGDEAYYPNRILHRDQPLRVQTADNLVSLIGRQNWGLKGGNPGGGGAMMGDAVGDMAGPRQDFAALAFFAPHINLDEQGRAKIKIKMPENISTFKLFAVATGHGPLSGTGQSSVLVTRDLLVRPALPAYAGVGDEFQASTVVSNRGKKPGQAKVSLSGENFTLLDNAAEKIIAVGPGESHEVGFMVKAGKTEAAKFQFTVNMGQDEDSAIFTIPVSPANQLATQASYERIVAGSWRTDLALPEGADLSRGGIEIELSPSLAGVLSEPFDWLLAYPHGCIEQSISRAFGSLTWLELQSRFPSDSVREKTARRNVEEVLAKISGWENGGGFNTWPGMSNWTDRNVYLSAYVLDFILSAQEAGFKLPYPELVPNIQNFLKQSLDSEYKYWPSWYSDVAVVQSRSYALAMLSRSGENVAAYISVMYYKRNSLGLYELANLARAINYQTQTGKDLKSSQLGFLIKLMEKHINVTAGEIQFADNSPNAPEIWATPVRNTAIILKLLCEAEPNNDLIPSLVRWLAQESKSGHFGSTHNNALAISALAKYVKVMEPENPDLSISVILGDKTLVEGNFKSFTSPQLKGAAPLSAVPNESPTAVYNLEGKGQAWSALKIRSAPAEPDLSAATTGGFMLSRSFTVLDTEGKGTPGYENFKRGDLVRVTVTMMAPAKRHSVVLEDRVPAGFEPVNFNLRDADQSLQALLNPQNSSDGFFNWYIHQEIWPDKVAVYADYLPAGVYTYSYLVRAVTPGTYLTPGPQAEEMYAPETFGRGEGQRLTVK